MKIEDSKLIQEMVEYFSTNLMAEINKEEVGLICNRLVEAQCRFLSQYKSKEMRVGIGIKTLNTDHNFLFGMAVDYIPPEGNDEETPGSWNVVASMNEDDIKPDKKVKSLSYDLQSDLFTQELQEILFTKCEVRVEKKDELRVLCAGVFEVISRHFSHIMAKTSDEKYSIEFGNFSIEAEKKGDSFTTKVMLSNEMKQIVKDDTIL